MTQKLCFIPSIRWFLGATLLFLLTSCGTNSKKVDIDRAWVRTPLPSKTTTSAYAQLRNNTTDPITLISADSTTVGKIEFHKSELNAGMHRMIKLDTLQIPAKDTLQLEPGGLHLMLFRVQDVEDNRHVINFHTETDFQFHATFKIREDESD